MKDWKCHAEQSLRKLKTGLLCDSFKSKPCLPVLIWLKINKSLIVQTTFTGVGWGNRIDIIYLTKGIWWVFFPLLPFFVSPKWELEGNCFYITQIICSETFVLFSVLIRAAKFHVFAMSNSTCSHSLTTTFISCWESHSTVCEPHAAAMESKFSVWTVLCVVTNLNDLNLVYALE